MAILQVGLLTRTKTTVSYEPEVHAIVLMGEDVEDVEDVEGRRAASRLARLSWRARLCERRSYRLNT